nr:hemolysin family protein [Seinonella peptonophila]
MLQLLLVPFLVLLNGFFVAAEFAIVKVRTTQIAHYQNRKGRMANRIVERLDAYLSATQLGITLASLGLGWAGEPAIKILLQPILLYFKIPGWIQHAISFSVAFAIITFLHIVIGEMAPKSLAIRAAEKVTLWVAVPLHWFYQTFRPFIYVLNSSANFTLRLIGVKELNESHQAHTEEEIRMLIEQSHQSGIIDQTERILFDNVFDFTERVAREVMVPRVNMICLYEDDPLDETIQIIKKSRQTRFPLCGEDKDDIKGIIHIRDVYEKLLDQDEFELIELARPTVLVPETMELKDILKNLQKNHVEMAIVVDEYGGTSGIVTTEDIIEEIFGEIQDEFDDEKPFFQEEGLHTSIDSRLLINDVNEYFQIDIEDADNDTIGGWLFSQLGKVPAVGDQVSFREFMFTVQEVSHIRITRILVSSKNNQALPAPELKAVE